MPSIVPLSAVYRAIEGRCKHCAATSLTSCHYQPNTVLLVGVPSIVPMSPSIVPLIDGECSVLLLIGRWRICQELCRYQPCIVPLVGVPSIMPLSAVYRAIEGRCKHCAATSLTSCHYQPNTVLLVGVPSIVPMSPSIVPLVDGECAVLLLIRCWRICRASCHWWACQVLCYCVSFLLKKNVKLHLLLQYLPNVYNSMIFTTKDRDFAIKNEIIWIIIVNFADV